MASPFICNIWEWGNLITNQWQDRYDDVACVAHVTAVTGVLYQAEYIIIPWSIGGKMCILFMYVGDKDVDSDYSLILASNRDELYDRPAQNMAPWDEDQNIIGGRDLETGCDGGTWLAMSPLRKKIGVLLNLPKEKRGDAKTRGKIVADYMRTETTTNEYIECIRNYVKECNDFVFVTVELGLNVAVQTYSNATDKLVTWTNPNLGFSNSLPEKPLRKVEGGKEKLENICSKFKKVNEKNELIENLINLLKSEERYLPDPEIEKRRPEIYKQLSSIFVSIPQGRYGTRTHTIILVTKGGHVDVVEKSLQSPIDLLCPKWNTTEFQYDIDMASKL